MPIIIDGKKISHKIVVKIKDEIIKIKKHYNKAPNLKVIIVGSDYASTIYVNNKYKKSLEAGIDAETISLPTSISTKDLLTYINNLNNDINTNAILVQLPLPKHLNSFEIINAISHLKDVDCFNYQNVGMFYLGKPMFLPCTPAGCMYLIKTVVQKFDGLHAVVIGASNIVGKPILQMLSNAGCTTSTVHKKTKHPHKITSQADILVSAVGSPELVKKNWVKKDAIIIDVGINRLNDNKIVGDVNREEVLDKIQAITLVPGGVGPLTVTFLLLNTLKAFYLQNNINMKDSIVNKTTAIVLNKQNQ